VVLDPQLKVRSANNTFYQIFNLKPQQVIQKHLYKIDKGRWDIPELRDLLEEILPKNTSFENYEFDYQKGKTGQIKLRLNARRIYRDAKKTELILLAIRDITLEKQHQQHLRDLTEQLLIAEEKQRQLVATALHDSIGQMLSYSKRELGAVSKFLPQEPKKTVDRVRKEINKAISQTRQLTTDLSPPTLHTFGLSAAIEEMLEELAQKNDVAFDFEGNNVHLPISKDFKILLYRSAKEILANIAKHAKAKKVSVEIGLNNEHGYITISDDGKGFDVRKLPEQVSKKRKFGLFSIRQRLDNIGGKLDIESKKNKGTKVQITVPLDNSTNKKG
jgi:PAS domain S-box-containing protein